MFEDIGRCIIDAFGFGNGKGFAKISGSLAFLAWLTIEQVLLSFRCSVRLKVGLEEQRSYAA
jgi:hypothetical protein